MHTVLRRIGDQDATIKRLEDQLTVTTQTVETLTAQNAKRVCRTKCAHP